MKRALLTGCLFLNLAAGTLAEAKPDDIVVATINGFLDYSLAPDPQGFGGSPFQAVFHIDLQAGATQFNSFQDYYYYTTLDGVTPSVTIDAAGGNVTLSDPSGDGGSYYRDPYNVQVISNGPNGGYVQLYTSLYYTDEIDPSFSVPVSETVGLDDIFNSAPYTFITVKDGGKMTTFGGAVTSFTLSGAPDLAGWCLMVTGCAAAGGALRRRRVSVNPRG